MAGHTYRFFEGDPLYPFGYGLSYTSFAYGNLNLSAKALAAGESLRVSVDVTNSGDRAAYEVVQLYLRDLEASVAVPLNQLCGFKRIHLDAGATATVTFELAPEMMQVVLDDGRRAYERGAFCVTVGGCSPGVRGQELGAPAPATAEFTLE